MRFYFAYGSNMSRERLEERTGIAECIGHTLLDDYVHSFSHRGADGTAKGNIEPASGHLVRGVLYRLHRKQIELLQPYEGGYEALDVKVVSPGGGEVWDAYTYMAPKDADGLLPREFYVAHYQRGMEQHQFPLDYIERILRQAGR